MAGSNAEKTTAARMRRLQLTLTKALDVSVSQASAASLRAALETHCENDLALLEQFFPREEEDADELSANTLLSLRQKIEVCEVLLLACVERPDHVIQAQKVLSCC